MKVLKHIWRNIVLDEACAFIRGVVFSTKDEVDTGGIAILRSHNVVFESSKISLHNLKFVSKNVKVKESQRFIKNDILISIANSKEQTGKVGFANYDTDAYAGGFMAILRPNKAIEPFYLYLYLLTDTSRNFIAGRTQGTTNIFNITFERIKDLVIPLPPLEEQKQIVELFQSIETALEQVEEQEQRLTELRKSLCKGLLLKEPIFGKLLNKGNCSIVKFSNFAESIEKHDKNKKDVHRFVGLENIEPEDFTIKTWGNIEDGTTFTKLFQKGDVLFGKRRAYLKKVAVTDFDGICSSDILVLRAKQDKIIPELLPFYISADPFIQYAVSTSAGSLSPRTKWKDLGELEVSLPEIEIQKKILAVLQSVEGTRNQLVLQKSNLKKLKQQLLNEILG